MKYNNFYKVVLALSGMSRVGKVFELGAPYLSGSGIVYTWHDSSREFEELFNEGRGELGKTLVSNLKVSMKDFNMRANSPVYPYLQDGMKGFALHMDGGGRWIDVQPFIGDGIMAFHNLDYWKERVAGFNIGSDVIEYFDKGMKAPRISREGSEYVVEYFLPEGSDLLPIDSNRWFFEEEGLERVFEVSKFGGIERDYQGDFQRISCNGGDVVIRDGVCRASGFRGRDICEVTFPMAKLLDSFAPRP
jgi:hypothetical protein